MEYQDIKAYLRIADNAYDVGAYREAAEILDKVVREIIFDTKMPTTHKEEFTKIARQQVARFQFCPDECCWEDVTSLNDLFRDL